METGRGKSAWRPACMGWALLICRGTTAPLARTSGRERGDD